MSWHYENMLSEWVTGRCVLRDAKGERMPTYVKYWLDGISKGPGGVDPHEDAPSTVLEWVGKTIEDPDWG